MKLDYVLTAQIYENSDAQVYVYTEPSTKAQSL